MVKRLFILGFFCSLFLGAAENTEAAELTYQYGEKIFTINTYSHPAWRESEEIYTFEGAEIVLQEEEKTSLPEGVVKRTQYVWDKDAIAKTLERQISSVLDRKVGSVRIFSDATGNIAFAGRGLPGRIVDTDLAAKLTVKALEEGIYTIQLPVEEERPYVKVDDPELRRKGIREVVTVGESDFSRSPVNRRYNIALGLSKFNGHLIEQGKEFSFNDTLGPVNSRTGFRRELTIVGDRTLPAYGGGLCQVSTTAYRGVWKAGFPITGRRNHSYAVRYYAPAGTDATIFPPWTDMSFVNDTRDALLIQTFTEDDNAYFVYYGTKPTGRTVDLIGPYTWDLVEPPEDRTGFTTLIPEGETRIVGMAVPGMKTLWYRSLTYADGTQETEEFLSEYAARPNYEETGVALDDPRAPEEDGIKALLADFSG